MSEKFAFIDAEKAMFPIVKMCGWLGVSTSGFYDWLNRSASATARRRTHLAALIQAIFDESDGTYGYRRVHAALTRQGMAAVPNWSARSCVSWTWLPVNLVRGGRAPPRPARAPRPSRTW